MLIWVCILKFFYSNINETWSTKSYKKKCLYSHKRLPGENCDAAFLLLYQYRYNFCDDYLIARNLCLWNKQLSLAKLIYLRFSYLLDFGINVNIGFIGYYFCFNYVASALLSHRVWALSEVEVYACIHSRVYFSW